MESTKASGLEKVYIIVEPDKHNPYNDEKFYTIKAAYKSFEIAEKAIQNHWGFSSKILELPLS